MFHPLRNCPEENSGAGSFVPEAFQTSSCDEIGWFSFTRANHMTVGTV
jgi:hypothetical protein